ncbi:D-Ala-D-Ala carboxypeptidase family metallohydrolase [Hylemonella sp. W303a]|uniref:D-Ala-D-Ala carboxypeptidase family metallohydrolase n=1 Tax=Hylemonella sp. W303a TaxID=3389873 RepID=UPI00396AF3CC
MKSQGQRLLALSVSPAATNIAGMQDDLQLSQHFRLSEFTVSQAATRAGLRNSPSNSQLGNLRRLAEVLEQVRQLLGKPVFISSGYRSPVVNAIVGGSATSAHMQGLAADFTCPGFGSPLTICRFLANSALAFNQLIYEGTWVHLGIGHETQDSWRREILTAVFETGAKTRYMKGIIG